MARAGTGIVAVGLLVAGMAAGASAAPRTAATARSSTVHAASTGPTLPGTSCPSFPADSVWNTPITTLPVDSHSATWLAAMDAGSTNLHPDYGPSDDPSTPYGIPWNIVTNATPTTPISFEYASESDAGPYPFTAATSIEGGQGSDGDRHAIMVNADTCTLYELWDASYSAGGSTAGSGAIWSLTSDALRPDTWTSADAAGLPILPLLVNYDQVAAGAMDHAIRVTAACTQNTYLWPARHAAGNANANCPPMGARFRLNASFTLPASACSAFCQTVITTMKTYGLVVADNGSNWFFQGTADTRWTDDEMSQLKQIPASAFQAVDESCLEQSAGSAQAWQPGSSQYDSSCLAAANDCQLSSAVVGIAPANVGGSAGYLRVDSGGQVCATGSAVWAGDLSGDRLNGPLVGIAATPDGRGYWLLGSDGGVFSFGDATFHGSTGSMRLNKPVVGMTATSDGGGYWLVASDGGIFAFGDATFHGSTGSMRLNKPVVAMSATGDGGGYTLVASDGGAFTFGDASFHGSLGSSPPASPVVGLYTAVDGGGYTLVDQAGEVFNFGSTA